MADGSVTIEVTLTKDQLEKGLKSLKSTIDSAIPSASSTLSTFSSAFSKIGTVATSVGKVCSTVTTAIAGVFTAASSKALNFIEVYESAMSVFERKLGTTGADEMYESLLSIAKGSKYAQEYIVSAGQTLVAMGVSASDTAQYVQVATDAMSGMGKSGTEVQALAEVFGKMSMQTTLYTEDLNQLLTNGVPVYDILSAKYKTSASSIKEMASAGELTSDDFAYLMDVLSGNVAEMEEFSIAGLALAGKSGTLSGAIDSLNSSFRSFALDMLGVNVNAGQTENYEKLINVVSTLGTVLEDIGDKFSFVGDWFGDFLDKLATVTETTDESGNTIKVYGGILGEFKNKLDSLSPETLEKIASAILKLATAGPILLAVGKGFSTLSGVFSGLSSVTSVFGKFTSGVSSFVGNSSLFKKAVTSIENSLIDLPGGFGTAFTGIFSVLDGKGGMILSTFTKIFNIAAIVGLVVAGLGLIQSQFGEKISEIANTAITQGPTIITNLITGIVSKIPDLISQGSQLIQTLLDVLIANLPSLIEGGVQIISSLIIGIANEIPNLVPKMLEVILTIVNSLIANLPLILNAGIQLLMGLINGIIACIPTLVAMLPTIINTIVSTLLTMLPQILEAGVQLLVSLVNRNNKCYTSIGSYVTNNYNNSC